MQAVPLGMVMMIVQLLPALDDRTSITPPLLARPIATGASEYFFDRCVTTSPRLVQAGCCAAVVWAAAV